MTAHLLAPPSRGVKNAICVLSSRRSLAPIGIRLASDAPVPAVAAR